MDKQRRNLFDFLKKDSKDTFKEEKFALKVAMISITTILFAILASNVIECNNFQYNYTFSMHLVNPRCELNWEIKTLRELDEGFKERHIKN